MRTESIHDGSNVRISMVQMLALNTQQFSWVKTRLPHKLQPAPPIYQPEAAADAVYWAAPEIFDFQISPFFKNRPN